MRWIIYLLSLTDPTVRYTFVITKDSITYYDNGYKTKKIIYEEKPVYVFDGGFASVRTNYAWLEFFGGRKVKYTVTNTRYEEK